MAISFSRPDPSSPAAVGSAAFPTSRRGFDQAEVRDFLKMVAAEMARLQERERFLESEMRAMQTRGLSAPGRLDEETVTTLLGEEAARVLTAARDASTQIRDRAEESATRLVKDAAEDAVRIRESAVLEAARIREDSGADAESEIEMAKQQGRDMVNEAREYREKVLSELSRRRDAARSQIEQLLHGRDRLMNAFERARIASEDVIGGLTEAHDEPEFIVDLSPTTGPVPIVNSEHPSVKVFDREEVIAEEVPTQDPINVVIFDHETEVELEVPVDEVVVEVIHETSIVEVLHPVHTPTEVTPVIDDVAIPEVQDSTQTNVVSLFGRGRRSVDMPEIEIEPEQLATETHVAEVVEEVVVRAPKTDGVVVDDIFAKLRAGSTADVAAKSAKIVAADDEVVPVAKAEKKTEKKAKAKPVPTVADPVRFAERDEELSPVVVAMARKLKRVLADEQNTVLGHVRAKRSSLEIDAVLGTEAEHSARYATAVAEDSMAAASAGAKSVKAAGGSSRRVTQKAIAAHAVSAITAGLVASFREEARIAIGEAEGDREVLLGLIRDVYRAWKSDRIDSHVEDIACSSYSHGAYLALEPGSRITWMAEPDTNCCSECEDNSLGGSVVRGDDFPTGHSHPPAHAGCRCLVCPVQD
ncbi:MAG: DivIVA domain-containing protein [Actinomycetota bacterium]